MRHLAQTGAFKHSYKLMKKRGSDMKKIHKAIDLLANDLPLPPSYKDHQLSGDFSGFRDIHVEPDWILIYKKKRETKEYPNGILHLEITGTHSDLFGK